MGAGGGGWGDAAGVVAPQGRVHFLSANPSAGLEFLPKATAQAKLVRLVEGAKKAQEILT